MKKMIVLAQNNQIWPKFEHIWPNSKAFIAGGSSNFPKKKNAMSGYPWPRVQLAIYKT